MLVATFRADVALELDDVPGRIDHHERLVLVSAAGESESGRHEELDPKLLDMLFQPREIFHAQERQAEMPRVGAGLVSTARRSR